MNDALPLLWLPGLLCNNDLYDPVSTLLSDRVTPMCADLALETRMDKIAESVLAKVPDHFILGGVSMGGILAFEVYRQAPERVKGLILSGIDAADESPEVTVKRNVLVEMARQGQFSQITSEIMMPILIHPNRLEDSSVVDCIIRMSEELGVDAYLAHTQALATRPDFRTILPEIDIPTLVICGRNDRLCPVKNHTLIAEQIPSISLHVLENCGHLATLEKPDLVADHINNWLGIHAQCFFETVC